MRGSTRKRGKTWTAYWQVEQVNTETGQREQRQQQQGRICPPEGRAGAPR